MSKGRLEAFSDGVLAVAAAIYSGALLVMSIFFVVALAVAPLSAYASLAICGGLAGFYGLPFASSASED